IHGDLFRDNALFDPEGRLAAVIDWGFCASGFPMIFDLAIAANDWCLAESSGELAPDKMEALLRGRCAIAPLTETERESWPLALR
ncbi:MAG: phosphotransferase, partial [Alphaproteobacteria bacterium]|nr:phosphotransferase [Alphaproteobacteria bacterium]